MYTLQINVKAQMFSLKATETVSNAMNARC